MPRTPPGAGPRSLMRSFGERLAEQDARLLLRALESRTPANDLVLRAASRTADRSLLWLAVSGVLGTAGGSRGRRAAARGLVGIGLASAVVNGPLKFLWQRQRPAADLVGAHPSLVRMPTSFSFPSGHSASAFAFATGVAREWPAVGVATVGAAAVVAYSRVHTGVHFPGDVAAGVGLGVAAGAAAGLVLRDRPGIRLPSPSGDPVPRRAVLLTSVSAGSASSLTAGREALAASGFEIVREVAVEDKAVLRELADLPAGERPLVIAAGGDGTVGAAADELAGTGVVMAILPLGTSNDVARSLGLSVDPVEAVQDLAHGVVRAIDAGRLVVEGRRDRHFVHAATVGFNVRFAHLATRSSLRRRFGRFTYAVAGIRAMREHRTFTCVVTTDDGTERLDLVQLSIVNAPVFGGALDLRVPGARLDDRSLVVVAVEPGPLLRTVVGAVITTVGRRHHAVGVRVFRTRNLRVHVEHPMDVALDGEISASLPADFAVAADALRVVTPRLADDRA